MERAWILVDNKTLRAVLQSKFIFLHTLSSHIGGNLWEKLRLLMPLETSCIYSLFVFCFFVFFVFPKSTDVLIGLNAFAPKLFFLFCAKDVSFVIYEWSRLYFQLIPVTGTGTLLRCFSVYRNIIKKFISFSNPV